MSVEDGSFKYYLETIAEWDAMPDDRTQYIFESGVTAVGRPIYSDQIIGRQALWITFGRVEDKQEVTVGVFAVEVKDNRIQIDLRDRVSPILESNIARVKRYWDLLPKTIQLADVIVPPKAS